ncbi:hypothetical protein [Streptomyces sp. yara]|uniref:hypothetical protein n=1 Tax=Streptomyces sp. yara TaxID=3458421 RepID=UPI00403FEF18
MTTSPRQERRSALPLPLADQTVLSFRFTPSPRGARLAAGSPAARWKPGGGTTAPRRTTPSS